MRRGALAILLGLLLGTGCARAPAPAAAILARADAQMEAENYAAALELYALFLRESGNDPAAPRARAARIVLDRLLTSRVEVERLQREAATREADLARLARDAVARDAELARLRRDVAARQAEVDRLKADLDRLRDIDIRTAPKP